MKKIELYRLKGLYREDFVVEGYRFGGEENSACIVGALRGNEMSWKHTGRLHMDTAFWLCQRQTVIP